MEPAEYIARTRALGAASAGGTARLWASEGLWEGKLSRAAVLVSAGQARAAELSESYMVDTLGAVDLAVDPRAFAGVASDGRPLASLLRGAAVAASGVPAVRADAAARAWLWMTVATQVADAARAALRSSMAVRDAGGVRVASMPCCGRCAILHGRHYSWRADFPRHPHCDCTFQPVAKGGDWEAPDEIPLDQIRGLSKADREAIELGADRAKVINAQRGMYSADVHGVTVKATVEGSARRGTVRLRPESILRHARDQEDAIRLLKLHGYVV